MKCLENLIGISNTDCICVTDGLSEAQKAELKLKLRLLIISFLKTGLPMARKDKTAPPPQYSNNEPKSVFHSEQ